VVAWLGYWEQQSGLAALLTSVVAWLGYWEQQSGLAALLTSKVLAGHFDFS
jgi:hypothetical protein